MQDFCCCLFTIWIIHQRKLSQQIKKKRNICQECLYHLAVIKLALVFSCTYQPHFVLSTLLDSLRLVQINNKACSNRWCALLPPVFLLLSLLFTLSLSNTLFLKQISHKKSLSLVMCDTLFHYPVTDAGISFNSFDAFQLKFCSSPNNFFVAVRINWTKRGFYY